MNYIEIAFLALTGSALLLGLLLGLLRGSRRAVLRLILIILCVVAAFCLRGFVTQKLMAYEITSPVSGEMETVEQVAVEYLDQVLPEDFSQLGEDLVMPIAKLIVTVVIFLVAFILLQIVSWLIIYPICKIFVKKPQRKHALFGGLIGLVQGVVVALVICIPLSGLVFQTNRILAAVSDISDSTQTAIVLEEVETAPEEDSSENFIFVMLDEFEQSTIGQIYGKIGEKPFSWIASMKTEEGKQITLTGQIDAVESMLKIARKLMDNMNALQGIDFSDMDSISDLKEVFAQLDEINGELSPEAKETVNMVVGVAIDKIPVPDNSEAGAFVEGFKDALKDVDFTDVKFVDELEIIENISACANKDDITVEDVSQIINDLSESTLILPVLENMDTVDMGLSNKSKTQLENVISQLPEDTDQETLDVLKNLLGLNAPVAQP